MDGWTLTEADLLLHERPSTARILPVAEESQRHPEHIEQIAVSWFDSERIHRNLQWVQRR
jgi:hypothetical protein